MCIVSFILLNFLQFDLRMFNLSISCVTLSHSLELSRKWKVNQT